MSRRRTYSDESLAIMHRFFDALDACITHGLVKNEYQFCLANGIDRRNLYHQRQDIYRGYFEVGWLLGLMRLGVSSSWLLTGRGSMFDASSVSVSLRTQPNVIVSSQSVHA